MSILVAPDSFKGTFTAVEVAGHIAAGIRSAGAAATELPVADGGEGTTEALARGLDARPVLFTTVGPWGEPVEAAVGLTADGTAVVELAVASGLNLPTAGGRDPLTASTYGTGVLIAEAARQGARRIVVAAGGSATTDGGAGAIAAIEERGGLRGADVVILSDVTTRFSDAARVFGPQKGAGPAAVELLTHRLELLAAEFARDYGRDPRWWTGPARRVASPAECGPVTAPAWCQGRTMCWICWASTRNWLPAARWWSARAGWIPRPARGRSSVPSWPVPAPRRCTRWWDRWIRTSATTQTALPASSWRRSMRPQWPVRLRRLAGASCPPRGTCPPLARRSGHTPVVPIPGPGLDMSPAAGR